MLIQRLVSLLLLEALISACVRPSRLQQTFQINLFTGIPGLVHLGESETEILNRSQFGPQRLTPPSNATTTGITSLVHFTNAGVKAYLNNGYVVLIEIQEPFSGTIVGKKLKLFQFSIPAGNSWETLLVRELGTPKNHADGGRLGSEALIYDWGDIAFNRMGPNEIALYRNNEMAQFRLKNFGRVVQFFAGPR